MKIICDTNIWYLLAQDEELFKKVQHLPLHPTFVNIYELSKTTNLINKEALVRSAIQKMFYFVNLTIYEPPFIYLAKIHNNCKYDFKNEISTILEFTSRIANGDSIKTESIEDFEKYSKSILTNLGEASALFNQEAERIKPLINKRVRKSEDTVEYTCNFINYFVEWATNKTCNLNGFDFNKIELFTRVLDLFLKRLEISPMKIQSNDWNDFAILSYVQPNDKYWTQEKRWIRLINDAGMSKYLFEV